MKHRRSILVTLLSCLSFSPLLQAETTLPQNYEELTTELENKGELFELSTLAPPEMDLSELEAKVKKSYSGETPDKRRTHSYNKNSTRRENEKKKKSWVPRFDEEQAYRLEKSFFFRTDIGLGLLYFSKISGRLAGKPSALFPTTNANWFGKLGYNRTPVYDFFFGYRFFPWLQTGFNYTHQGNVTVYTENQSASPNIANAVGISQFSSNLSLDAISLRVYADGPWPVIWRNLVLNSYLGTGVGVGWQTWAANQLLTSISGGAQTIGYLSDSIPFKQKISTNCFWGADLGIRIRNFSGFSSFSVSGGMKFNLWGQALNIGDFDQQGSYKFGLAAPLRVRMVYQWAPYLSVQWNFSNGNALKTKMYRKSEMSPMLTQMNVGIGFLKFKNVRGNLIGLPNQNGLTNGGWQTATVSQKISYNRTPLFEYLLQHRFNDYAQLGLSYQNQGGVVVQSQALNTGANGASMVADYAQLSSYLNLNAVLVKGYVLFPLLPRNRFINFTPYFGLGFGPAWQTWSRVSVYRTGFSNQLGGLIAGPQPLRQKISANVMLSLDFGLKVTSIHEKNYFSLVAGCKYNYWGQARNIGLQSQQGRSNVGLNAPFIIKRIYQWAPYLGVQWNFPNNYYGNKPYYVEGLDPCTWKPFRVDMDLIQKSHGVFTQMNVGLGLLYFRGLSGNLAGIPPSIYQNISTSVPLKGRLTYNRTPLFEYQLGYRFCPLLKVAFSYQHQGNVTVQTKLIRNQAPSTATAQAQYSQLSADLVLDAFMFKALMESPKAIIWRNVASTMYVGAGIGPAWQTWKRVFLNQPMVSQGEFVALQTSFRQRISPNLAFMVDTGLRIQSPYPNTGFSALLGCKFNFWGQAYSIGDIRDQPRLKQGLFQPFKVLTVYQWAPYLGVQWNF